MELRTARRQFFFALMLQVCLGLGKFFIHISTVKLLFCKVVHKLISSFLFKEKVNIIDYVSVKFGSMSKKEGGKEGMGSSWTYIQDKKKFHRCTHKTVLSILNKSRHVCRHG